MLSKARIHKLWGVKPCSMEYFYTWMKWIHLELTELHQKLRSSWKPSNSDHGQWRHKGIQSHHDGKGDHRPHKYFIRTQRSFQERCGLHPFTTVSPYITFNLSRVSKWIRTWVNNGGCFSYQSRVNLNRFGGDLLSVKLFLAKGECL